MYVVVRQRKTLTIPVNTNGICFKIATKNIFIFTKTFLQDTIGELIGKQLSSIRHTSHITNDERSREHRRKQQQQKSFDIN